MENQFDFYNEAHEGHRDRLRQRIVHEGVEDLKNHELLEFMLCYVIPRQDVNALAHGLINRFGNIKEVFTADYESLMQVEGMGDAAAQWIQSLGSFASACSKLNPDGDIILNNYGSMYSFARTMKREYENPCCVQLLMDYRGRLIYRRMLGSMPEWGKMNLLQDSISDAITLNASCAALIILAGRRVSYPSNYDRDMARKYARMLNSAGISLMDALICGSTGVISLRRLNMISENLKRSPRNSLREGYISSIRPAKLKHGLYRFYCAQGGNYERIEPV